MTTATFLNWTDETFVGYWNGKPKTFKGGERLHMPAWLAEHFAKHLTNRELIKAGKETATSPKFPAQVPEFMELFNRAFIPDNVKASGGEIDDIIASAAVEEPSMNIAVKQPAGMNESSPAAAQAAQIASDAAPVEESGATVLEGPDDEDDYQPPAAPTAPAAPAGPAIGLA